MEVGLDQNLYLAVMDCARIVSTVSQGRMRQVEPETFTLSSVDLTTVPNYSITIILLSQALSAIG